MKNPPLVSVILPAYNRAQVIGRAIRSVLDQTFDDFELIIIDDGSTDNTREVIKTSDDKRIELIVHAKNKGGASARNSGIEKARGLYIAFLDSDDEWLPTKLEKQIVKIQQSERKVGLIYTSFYTQKRGKIQIGKMASKKGNIFKLELFEDQLSPTSTYFVRKSCFDKVGLFDEKLTARQDYDIAIRLAKYFDFDYLKEPLVIIHEDSENRIGSNIEKRTLGHQQVLEKVKTEIKEMPKTLQKSIISYHYFSMGAYCLKLGASKLGKKYLLKSIKVNCLNTKAWIFLGIGLFGKDFYRLIINIIEFLKRRIFANI